MTDKKKTQPIRKKFPQIYRRERNGNVYYEVSARSKHWGFNTRQYFPTEKEALEFARKIESEILEKGRAANQNLVVADSKIAGFTERLNVYGKTIEDAVEHFIEYLGNKVVGEIVPPISKLAITWRDSRLTDKINPISKPTQNEFIQYAKWIGRVFGTHRPAEVDFRLCREKINSLKVGNTTRRKYTTYLRNFFLWCKQHDYTDKDPTEGIKVKLDNKEIHTYENDQIKIIVNLARTEEFKPLFGSVILSTFLGLRPSETLKVEWKHVNFSTKELYVPKSKTAARHVSINETAFKWLKDYQTISSEKFHPLEKGRHTLYRRFTEDVIPAKFPWISDGLRHTWGSNHFNLHRNIILTAHEMGNSVSIAKRHYCKTIEKEKVEAFWAFDPSTK